LGIEAVQVLGGAPGQLPVFFCVGWNGSVTVLMRYQELIRRLGNKWPLYGLVANGCSDPKRLFTTMEGMVDAALLALRQVQPHGPYLLVGECLGGKLAFELARRLEREGEEIASLILLDAPLRPKPVEQDNSRQAKVKRQSEIWRERIEHHRQQLLELGWRAGASYLVERLLALLPDSLYPHSTFRPRYLAHQRYVNLLSDYEPVETLACSASAVFTSHFQHHQPWWAARLQRLDVTLVEGTHQGYLAAAGDKVAALLRQLLQDAAPGGGDILAAKAGAEVESLGQGMKS
jgi:thioesterase domain-containing protein